jgi:hypothetical protein
VIIAFGVLTFVVAFFLLRHNGGVVRHLLAILFAAIVAPFLAYMNFQLFTPYGGKPSYSSPEVWQAMQLATVLNGGAIILGLLAGIVAATVVRRQRRVTG